MSVSALPEWKQLLLERKRREEEERERREREEEERLASMPVWKRGIIQRRRARQEGRGEWEKAREREGVQQSTEGNHDPDVQCDDQQLLGQTNSDLVLITEMDIEPKILNQVSVETIGPINQNPFIRSQNSWRRENWRRDLERENHGKERERDSTNERMSAEEIIKGKEKDGQREDGKNQERDCWRWKAREIRMERMKGEGKERDGAGAVIERRDSEKGRKEGERDSTCLPLAPGLRTIKAENIIIIEKEFKGCERETHAERGRRDGERVSVEEEKRGMRMDLREFLAGGLNVTEIRATEVLIIKPSTTEENCEERGERETERRTSKDNVTMNERGKTTGGKTGEQEENNIIMKETEAWPRNQTDPYEDSAQEKCIPGEQTPGRVSQLLSKFGESPKPPCRSKSTDSFIRPGRESCRVKPSHETEKEIREKEKREERREEGIRGVPKRSFSFSEHVVFVCEDVLQERRVVERAFSDRRTPPRGKLIDAERLESEESGGRRQGIVKNEKQVVLQRKREIEGVAGKEERKEQESGLERKRVEVRERDKRVNAAADGGEGFTVASVRNPAGIPFARRVPIKQDKKEIRNFRDETESERITERDGAREKEKETEGKLHKMHREITERESKTPLDTLEKMEPLTLWRDGEDEPVQTESKKSLCSYPAVQCHHSDSHSASDNQLTATSTAIVDLQAPGQEAVDGTPDCCRCGKWPLQTVPPQALGKLGWVQDIKAGRLTKPSNAAKTIPQRVDEVYRSVEKEFERSVLWQGEEKSKDIGNIHIYRLALPTSAEEGKVSVPRSPKSSRWLAGDGQHEFLIPRAVFYGVDELPGRPGVSKNDRPFGGEEKKVERKGSWKAGRPLTRVDSLRERIHQRELERQRRGEEREEEYGGRERHRGEGEKMEGGEQRSEVGCSLRGVMGSRQEEASPQTLSTFDVREEVSVSKAGPQLPASVPFSLLESLSAGQEAPRLTVEISQGGKQHYTAQGDTEQHEEGSRREQDTDGVTGAPSNKGERKEEEPQEEEQYLPPSFSPSPPGSLSPSHSPPFPNSLAAMSRIYNLKTVGSRTTVCFSDRNSDVPPHRGKTRPEGQFSHTTVQTVACPQDRPSLGIERMARDSQAMTSTETSNIRSVQRQVEKLQLREQEVRSSSPSDRDAQHIPQKESMGKVSQSQKRTDTCTEMATPQMPTEMSKPQTAKEVPAPQTSVEISQSQAPAEIPKHQMPTETSKAQIPTSPRTLSTQEKGPRLQTKIPQAKSFTINARSTQSPENVQKPAEQLNAATTPSSVSSSPVSSSISPPLFSIRSASNRPGKRGATITITPRKPATGTAPASPSETTSPSRTTSQNPLPAPNSTGAGGKKRYPTAEEIEVIGGYQNLENSCLVKNRGTPKGVKVCFDEAQLEQLCEYPSENFLLATLPGAGEEQGNEGRQTEGDSDAEEEEERGAFVPCSTKSVGTVTGTARVLRVDESCRR